MIKVPLKWSFRDYKHVQWELTVGYNVKQADSRTSRG